LQEYSSRYGSTGLNPGSPAISNDDGKIFHGFTGADTPSVAVSRGDDLLPFKNFNLSMNWIEYFGV
jgi:hypothetical protein